MSQVKIGTDGMPVPDKVQFVRQVVIDMNAAAGTFVTPVPALTAITTAATALETAYNAALTARQVAKSKTATMVEVEKALDLLVSQLANYVENTSGGDQAKIESSGFGVRRVPAPPIGPLPAPTDMSVAPNEHAGTMDMDWRKVNGAKSYVIERAVDAPVLVWTPALTTTKSKAVVNTMTSGSKYWFRVAAVGAAGQGPWSDAIAKFAT
jgi:hypothetical protein